MKIITPLFPTLFPNFHTLSVCFVLYLSRLVTGAATELFKKIGGLFQAIKEVVEKGIKLGSTALGAGTGILFGGGISGKITDTMDKMSDAASDVAGAMGRLGKTKVSEVKSTVQDTVKNVTKEPRNSEKDENHSADTHNKKSH